MDTMKKKIRKFVDDNMLPKFTAEDMFAVLLEERAAEELRQQEENIGIIDRCLNDLEVMIGREITEDEELGILDIIDEYTPKKENGNYLGPLLPFDYAWKIYKLKNEHPISD
jgi:hypothetical protein